MQIKYLVKSSLTVNNVTGSTAMFYGVFDNIDVTEQGAIASIMAEFFRVDGDSLGLPAPISLTPQPSADFYTPLKDANYPLQTESSGYRERVGVIRLVNEVPNVVMLSKYYPLGIGNHIAKDVFLTFYKCSSDELASVAQTGVEVKDFYDVLLPYTPSINNQLETEGYQKSIIQPNAISLYASAVNYELAMV